MRLRVLDFAVEMNGYGERKQHPSGQDTISETSSLQVSNPALCQRYLNSPCATLDRIAACEVIKALLRTKSHIKTLKLPATGGVISQGMR